MKYQASIFLMILLLAHSCFADPQVISITDSSFNNAQQTIETLVSHPLLSQIDAVRHRRLVTIPFTDTVASPRLIKGVTRLSGALNQFSNNNQEVN